MQDDHGNRIVFGDVVDRVFWGLLVSVSAYGVFQIQALNKSVAELNQSMAVLMYQVPDQLKRLERIEARQDRVTEEMRLLKLLKDK